ncbi:MAG: Gfo/Idh/MocA family oxidoreductase [Candidatus Brocadiaceae bacterium]|jgi:predicted dehydrogenase
MADRVRWGILGTADVAEKHFVPAVRGLDNSVAAAVASRDAGRAREFAERLDIPKACGSYEELITDPEVDAIYNPLPTALHAEWSIRCAEAGKPVLCEKPLAPNADAAQRMVDAFAGRGVLFAEALMYRFHPLAKRVKQMVEEGAVGEVRVIQAVFCAMCEDPANFRLRKDLGGGALLDVGSYCVSVMRMITGEEPEEVCSAGLFSENGVDLSLVGTLRFPSGAVGSFGCGLKAEFGCSHEIYGTEGRIFVPQGVVPNPSDEAVIRYWKQYECEEIVVPPANQWQLVIEDFADALLDDRPVEVPPEDGVRNLRVIDELLACAAR